MGSCLIRVHLVLIFVQLTFGIFHVLSKEVLGLMEPMALAGLRVLLATPLLMLLARKLEGPVPVRRELPVLALLGVLGVFLNQVCYVLGLQHTSSMNAGILMPSIPVFTAGVAVAWGVERLVPLRLLGVGLGAAGALVMLGTGAVNGTQGSGLGVAFILANCLSYAFFAVISIPVLKRLPPLTVTAWVFVFGGAATLLASLPWFIPYAKTATDTPVWLAWSLVYIVLVPTAMNYALIAWAMRRSSATLVATYTMLQSVATAALAIAWRGEALALRQVAGFGLIVLALVLVSRSQRAEA